LSISWPPELGLIEEFFNEINFAVKKKSAGFGCAGRECILKGFEECRYFLVLMGLALRLVSQISPSPMSSLSLH
jgi:hypothetical protein